jgi:hypothetical protein
MLRAWLRAWLGARLRDCCFAWLRDCAMLKISAT